MLKSIEKDLTVYSVSARIHEEESPNILYRQPLQNPLAQVSLVTGAVQVEKRKAFHPHPCPHQCSDE